MIPKVKFVLFSFVVFLSYQLQAQKDSTKIASLKPNSGIIIDFDEGIDLQVPCEAGCQFPGCVYGSIKEDIDTDDIKYDQLYKNVSDD